MTCGEGGGGKRPGVQPSDHPWPGSRAPPGEGPERLASAEEAQVTCGLSGSSVACSGHTSVLLAGSLRCRGRMGGQSHLEGVMVAMRFPGPRARLPGPAPRGASMAAGFAVTVGA